jgi:hypothetical protein
MILFKMKYFLASFFFLMFMPALPGKAQPGPGAKEKIQALKIAYITSAIDLSASEAQQFWPVYNEAEQKRKDLRKARFLDRKEAAEHMEEMSDKDAETYIDREIEFRQHELDVQKELHLKLKKILPSKKIARLYKAEVDFQRKVLHDLDEKQKGGR